MVGMALQQRANLESGYLLDIVGWFYTAKADLREPLIRPAGHYRFAG